MNNFSSRDLDILKKHYFNYAEKNNFNKHFFDDLFLEKYFSIIKLFSQKPLTTQEQVFNKFKFLNKRFIFCNEVIRNSKLAQN